MQQQHNISLKYQMDWEGHIRFQIMLYCYMNGLFWGDVKVCLSEIHCLTLIGMRGGAGIKSLCGELVEYGVCGTVGAARNMISKLGDKKLVYKKGIAGSNKAVYLNPQMNIRTEDNMLLNIQCYASKESQ